MLLLLASQPRMPKDNDDVEQCNRVNRLIFESRIKFYADTIKENGPNQLVLFFTFEKLLHLKTERKLPSHERALDLANGFADFFDNKVRTIRDNLTPSAGTYHDANRESTLELHELLLRTLLSCLPLSKLCLVNSISDKAKTRQRNYLCSLNCIIKYKFINKNKMDF